MYKIAKEQLVILWVVGVLLWLGNIFFMMSDEELTFVGLVFFLLLPGALAFYTVGWKKVNNKPKEFKKPKLESHEEAYSKLKITYFSVSNTKLILLSIFTFGVYPFFWFYKNWKIVSESDPSSTIGPIWRAFWSILYSYSLFKGIFLSWATSNKENFDFRARAVWFALCFALLAITGNISARVEDSALSNILFIIGLLSFVPIMLAQKNINENNEQIDPEYQPENKLTKSDIWFLALCWILFLVFFLASYSQ